MCGISGGVYSRADEQPPKALAAIVASQTNRGPDAFGYLERPLSADKSLWLAHNRLSIVDLTADANQPMVSRDGRYALVFNGMIYNYVELRAELSAEGYQFRTNSDTEVLLAAIIHWDVDAFARLYGMFALAFHDSQTQRLILARDRFGVKPLFYHAGSMAFRFASTPTAFAQEIGASINLEYAGRGVRLKYYEDEGEISPFDGICALPPGHYADIALARSHHVEPKAYYDLCQAVADQRDEIAGESFSALRRILFDLLKDATRIRLRADVPIGISLSGGVDSASVLAMCHQHGAQVTGFCFGNDDDSKSEGPVAKRLAASLGQQAVFIPQVTGKAAQALFWRTLHAQGAPFPHTSQIAQFAVFDAARSAGIKVMLGGQGGDEAFMGYRKFFLYQLRYILRLREINAVPAMARNIVQILPAIAGKASLFWKERGRYISRSGKGLGSGLKLPELIKSASPGMGIGDDPALRQILDVTRFSLPSLLRYEDRNSMGNSIESRLPFLDQRVIEFGIALPTATKLREGMGKFILRDAMRGKVTDEILFNRDSVDLIRAIKTGSPAELAAPFARVWLSMGLTRHPFFRRDAIRQSIFRTRDLAKIRRASLRQPHCFASSTRACNPIPANSGFSIVNKAS